MLDLKSEFGARVDRSLREKDIIWLTTVPPEGVPQPNPVWFLWDGGSILLYSQPDSYRIRNLQNNPKVSLHLEGADALGHNVIVITGEASLKFGCENPIPPTRRNMRNPCRR
jgi:PPOX class probable F420-dependent enzyme